MTGPSQSGSCRSCQQHEGEITDPTAVPWCIEFRSSKAFVTWVVAIAVFTVCLVLCTSGVSIANCLDRTSLYMAWYTLSRPRSPQLSAEANCDGPDHSHSPRGTPDSGFYTRGRMYDSPTQKQLAPVLTGTHQYRNGCLSSSQPSEALYSLAPVSLVLNLFTGPQSDILIQHDQQYSATSPIRAPRAKHPS